MAIAVVSAALIARAITQDFVDEVVFSGLTNPTNVEFSPDGRVFVSEKSGIVKVFDSITDPSPDTFADLRSNVHDFWDRGLLGLAIHPNFPTDPYIYVLYTYDALIGSTPPTWGDGCSDPPGATSDGCVVSGRLSRLTAVGNQMSGPEVVLIEDWCQQFPSHSIGDLEFGADGALYVSGGDGASFNWVDYGQGGGDQGSPVPSNPCGDPPSGVGGIQVTPTAEGGALRAQDMRTAGDAVSLDGTIIRVDPIDGTAFSDNPLIGNADLNARRIVADGLRNPFRIVIKPGTNEVFAGDVGWSTWEEVNHHPNPNQSVRNFGWPCYEGGSGVSTKQNGYDGANLDICEDLYQSGNVNPSLFAYRHSEDITGDDPCPPATPPQGTSSSISGLAFYTIGDYPGAYNGALFGSDYSRDCIWVMYSDSSGNPDPATVEVFQHQAQNPVDLETGPNGDIYYVNLNGGQVRRFRFVGTNTPPSAVLNASTTSGAAPLTVDFDASGSSDPDSDPIVLYEWDFDGDFQYDDATGETTQWTFDQPGSYTARLRVTDSRGESDTDSVSIQASNTAPNPVIDTPTLGSLWRADDTIAFSGHAIDPEEGALPPSSLEWRVILHHCASDGSCHIHGIQTFTGVASGGLTAPDHEYPSWLELELTAADQFGVESTVSLPLYPETVNLTFDTDPLGLDATFGGTTSPGPFTETVIVNSVFTVSTPTPQSASGIWWEFVSWSDGGNLVHTITAPTSDTTFTAVFNGRPRITSSQTPSVSEGVFDVIDLETDDDTDSEGSGLSYGLTGGVDQSLFEIGPDSGMLRFLSTPDFETPIDSDSNNVYEAAVTVTDSGGLSGTQTLSLSVTNVDEPPEAADDHYETLIDTTLNIEAGVGVLSNDTDPEGDAIDATQVSQALHGSVNLDPSGSFSYLPDANWSGIDGFTYEACDPSSNCSTATVMITVTGTPAAPPIITSDGGNEWVDVSTPENQKQVTDVDAFDINGDAEGSGLTYSLVGGADRTRLKIGADDGLLSFKLAPDFESPTDVGGDNRYDVIVQVIDSTYRVDIQVINVLVTDVIEPYNGTFSDDDDSMFEASIEWLAEAKITHGCNPPLNNLFCPKARVTRGQLATFIVRAFGLTDAGPGNLYIDDDGHIFEHAIDIFGTAGITQGCNPPLNNKFCPNSYVTRGQLATFFVRAFGLTDAGPGNLYIDDDGHIFEHAIDIFGTAGITQGCNPPLNNKFCPDDYLTREQVAAFFKRAFQGVLP